MSMADILLERLAHRADALAMAYTVNETTYAAHIKAVEDHVMTPSPETALAKITTGTAWDETRNNIINNAQYLLGTLAIVLTNAPQLAQPALLRQVDYLKEAFRDEAIACNRYLNFSGGNAEIRQEWQDTRGEIISRARPLVLHIRALVSPFFEGDIKTEVGT
jgi:hypothetical protein